MQNTNEDEYMASSISELLEKEKTQQAQLRDTMEIISGLASEYLAVYYINLHDNSFKVFSVDEKRLADTKKLISLNNDASALMNRFVMSPAVHPDDRDKFRDITIEGIKERLASTKKFSIHFRRDYGQGYLWSVMDIIKNEAADEEPNSIVVGFAERDEEIRREYEYQKQLKEAYEAANAANAAKTSFLFNMSHDIRTPMNAILGYTDIALRHFDDKEKAMDSLRKLKISGGHLLNLINDILEMSRIESGNLEINEKKIDIREATATVECVSRAFALPKNIEIEVKLGNIANPYIYADELHTNEIMINLISNAIKYTRYCGRVCYSIEQLDAPVDGKAVFRFEISDNGIGMSEEFQRHLFETFAREENTTVSRIEGAGLGLSIVKKIVDLFGGSISVQSTPGKGSCFTVDIPFRVMNEQEIDEFIQEKKLPDYIPEDEGLEGKRVLLVEDNEMNREISKEYLSDAGMDIETAEDGEIAVRMVIEKGIDYYDFILMDIQMPVMNGYEATRIIRGLPGGDSIPIIAVSANAFDEDKQRSLEIGMNAHIAKPIDIKTLLETMHGLKN